MTAHVRFAIAGTTSGVIARHEAIAETGSPKQSVPILAIASCLAMTGAAAPARRSVPLRRAKSKAPALRAASLQDSAPCAVIARYEAIAKTGTD
jgi:hypothetical protein